MSGNDEKRKLEAQYFPPPPPGPPPGQQQTQSQQQPPRHPDEVPIPDYNPSHPQYAPPPNANREDIYGASPTDENPPPFPPRPTSSGKGDEKVKLSWGQKLAGWGNKAAAPINALANKMGSEAFLPGPIDKEVEKAARILRSFCS